jgi:nucleotide-binding universal stress UspA family protein
MNMPVCVETFGAISRDGSSWLHERFARILLATDLCQNSKLALKFARGFADHFGSELGTLHVFEFGPHGQAVEALDHIPSRERKIAQRSLEIFNADAGYPNIAADVVVAETSVTSAITKFLNERSIDMLVIAAEGLRKGVAHFLLGSKTEELMFNSRHLVLTVGPKVSDLSGRRLKFERVLYVSDFSVASIPAATYAFELGEIFGVRPDLYQVVPEAAKNTESQIADAAAEFCHELRASNPRLPSAWFDADVEISRIVSEHDLMAAARESSNLIVLGVQPASFLRRHMHTSFAYRLLENAASPILTVPVEALTGTAPIPLYKHPPL